MKRNYNRTCDKINKLLSEGKENLVDELNEIMYKEVFQKEGGLYFDRELFISLECDDDKVRSFVVENPKKVIFENSDDPVEHPGVVVRFKPEMDNLVNIEWVDFNKLFNADTLKEMTSVSDNVLVMWYDEDDELHKEKLSVLTAHQISNGKVWTLDGRVCYDSFDYIVISKYCPLVI